MLMPSLDITLRDGSHLTADSCREWFSKNKTNLAKLSISIVFQEIISQLRNDAMKKSCWPVKIVVLLGSELAFALIIPLALIEFVVRGVIALIVLALKKCCCCQRDPYLIGFRSLEGAKVSLLTAVHSLKHFITNFNIRKDLCETPWDYVVDKYPQLDVSSAPITDSV